MAEQELESVIVLDDTLTIEEQNMEELYQLLLQLDKKMLAARADSRGVQLYVQEHGDQLGLSPEKLKVLQDEIDHLHVRTGFLSHVVVGKRLFGKVLGMEQV